MYGNMCKNLPISFSVEGVVDWPSNAISCIVSFLQWVQNTEKKRKKKKKQTMTESEINFRGIN